MDRERWRRLEGILDGALERPPEDVPAFLNGACGGDADLRREVEELLAAGREAGGFLETPVGEGAAELIAAAVAPAAGPETGPEAIGPYRMLQPIGRGGMGEVFEAVDTRLGRPVAMKLLSPLASGAGSKERFLREARAASALDHPNVCTVHDIGETDDGRLYIVMALYRGETLQQRLERGPMAPEEALDAVLQVARGLARAHDAGIVHRDIKPANVMLTEHGEVKILDFGIAKIAGSDGLTRTGGAPGTPTYMSPEQVLGEELDGRSDLWALGVMAYQMVTGRRPFPGETPPSVIHAILNRPPRPLDEHDPSLPPIFQRLVDRTLARDREDRYPDARALLEDLAPAPPSTGSSATGRQPAGGALSGPGPQGLSPVESGGSLHRLGRGTRALLGLALLLAVVASAVWWLGRENQGFKPSEEPMGGAAGDSGRPQIAVLFFQNLTGDPELDWLRTGLTDLLVSRLSQSPELGVRSTGAVFEALAAAGVEAKERLEPRDLRQVSQRLNTGTVVLGSYARAGERLRISFTVEEPHSGRILASESTEGRIDASLFSMVDDLAEALRRQMEVEAPAGGAAPQAGFETSSLDALRLYTEALNLQHQLKTGEALALLEKAVELDPGYAVALADLARTHGSLGNDELAREYGRRAVEHADRLPLRKRLWVEGTYHGDEWDTFGQAIGIYREAIEAFPDSDPFRDNLAALYGFQERYEEAAVLYRELIRRGSDFVGSHASAAFVLVALGRPERGEKVLDEFLREHPRSWYAHFARGWLLIETGRLEEAGEALRRAEALRPREHRVAMERWRLLVLEEDWPAAEATARGLTLAAEPNARWWGFQFQALEALYSGQGGEALRRLEEASRAYGREGPFSAMAYCRAAEIQLAQGNPQAALLASQQALEQGGRQWPAVRARFLAALALEDLGRPGDADEEAAALRQRLVPQAPGAGNRLEERQLLRLEGLLALRRGEAQQAAEHLEGAVTLLPAHSIEFHWHVLPDAADLHYELGLALAAAGRREEAIRHFSWVIEAGGQRVKSPLAYVHSHFRRGELLAEAGEDPKAQADLRRFLSLVRDGDLDRQAVEAAQAVLRTGS